MPFPIRCGRTHWAVNRTTFLSTILLVVSSSIVIVAQQPGAASPPKILQETFAFPPSIQWKVGDMEVSVIGLALGPVTSPEMLSKAREPIPHENAQFFPDQNDVVAVQLRVTVPRPTQPQTVQSSGLFRIKGMAGNIEYPSALTPLGLVAPFVLPFGVNDIPFKGSDTVEHWDFFPIPPGQREFLFEVIPPSHHPILSFRVTVKGDKFEVVNLTPGNESKFVQFTKNYGGTIGGEAGVSLQLGVAGTKVSGFGKYTQGGKSFWLKGEADSLGNFKLNEYHPENQLTGRLEGKFSADYRQMSGYFSKPDGSNLEPFEFQETDEAGYGGEGIGIPPCPTPNTPAGWKTYINERYRFCFSYPSTYTAIAEPWLPAYTGSDENSGELREAVREKRLLRAAGYATERRIRVSCHQ